MTALNLLSPAISSYLFFSLFLTNIGCMTPCSLIDSTSDLRFSSSKFVLGWKGLVIIADVSMLSDNFSDESDLLTLEELRRTSTP